MSADEKARIISWSGGKDSTATIIRAHELGLRVDLIIICLVWFDKKRGIYGDSLKKLDWLFNYAIPLFESWGYPVKIVTSDKDYLHYFYKVRQKSEKHPENIGKYYGFVMGGACVMQEEKVAPIRRYIRENYRLKKIPYEEIVGICADEPERIERMLKRKEQRSLLVEQRITQVGTRRICEENNLLSPTYSTKRKRDGCWFCPNQHIEELAELKTTRPDLWAELKLLSKVKNTVARGFKYGKTFDEIEAQVDYYIANPPPPSCDYEQLSLFDFI